MADGFTSGMWDVDEQSSDLKCLGTLKDDVFHQRSGAAAGQWWMGSRICVG